MMALLYMAIGTYYDDVTQYSELFLFLYGCTFFFSNFGPNVTTFVLPAEVFPTEVRATLHGFAAAMGKVNDTPPSPPIASPPHTFFVSQGGSSGRGVGIAVTQHRPRTSGDIQRVRDDSDIGALSDDLFHSRDHGEALGRGEPRE